MGPLSLGALHAVVQERLGVRLARPALVRLHESTEGNPYLALELVRAYGPEGPAAMLQGAPPTEVLRNALGHRIGSLPRQMRRLLETTALLGRPQRSLLVRLMGDDDDATAANLARAERAGLLRVEGDRVRIDHPLLASVIAGSIPTTERRRLHRRIAEAMDEGPSELGTWPPPPTGRTRRSPPLSTLPPAGRPRWGPRSRLPICATWRCASHRRTSPRRRVDAAWRSRRRSSPQATPGGRAENWKTRYRRSRSGTSAWRPSCCSPGSGGTSTTRRRAWRPPSRLSRRRRTTEPGRLGSHSALSWMLDFDLTRRLTHATAALELIDPDAEPALRALPLLNQAWTRLLTGHGADHAAIEQGDRLQQEAGRWDYSPVPGYWAKAMDQPVLARQRFRELPRPRTGVRGRERGRRSLVVPGRDGVLGRPRRRG